MTDEGRARRRRGTWIPLGRIGGVRIHLDPVLILLVALLVAQGIHGAGPTTLAFTLVGMILFVLWHEMGHALAARSRGLAVQGIYLHLFPVTYVEQGAPKDEWRVALAGPIANLLLAALLFLPFGRTLRAQWGEDAVWNDAGSVAILLNLAIGTLNLVPILPADGGRVVRALLTMRAGRRHAELAMAVWGTVVGAVLVVAAFVWAPRVFDIYVALLGAFIAYAGWRGVDRRGREHRA